MAIFSLGNLESTWFQVVAPPSSKILASCSKVRVSTNWFWAELTTASPSRPMRNSWYLMPLASQAAFSSSSMGGGGVGDVGLAGAERGEAAARAGGAHRNLHARLLLAELLGDGLADRGHGRGDVDGDSDGEAQIHICAHDAVVALPPAPPPTAPPPRLPPRRSPLLPGWVAEGCWASVRPSSQPRRVRC